MKLQNKKRLFTPAQLRQFRGTNNGPIYIALKNTVYDVTSHPSGRGFYGSGSAYHVFAGANASRALATSALDAKSVTLGSDISGLSLEEYDTLHQWMSKFNEKYAVVGYLVAASKL